MRLIDADKLLSVLKKNADECYGNQWYSVANGLKLAQTYVDDMATEDPASTLVDEGNWDVSESEVVGGQYHHVSRCTVCNWHHEYVEFFTYCPECGSYMRGEVRG